LDNTDGNPALMRSSKRSKKLVTEEVTGSIPVSTTSVVAGQKGFRRFLWIPFFDLAGRMGAKRGANGSYADWAGFWLKIAFIVVAPVVMTDLSW
jgi:hypothetical protein